MTWDEAQIRCSSRQTGVFIVRSAEEMHAGPNLPILGGCLCGAIRYQASTPPIGGSFCHCGICRKNSGSVFQASLEFLRSDFEFTQGEPSYYKATPLARRGFCPGCGSPLVFQYEGTP